MTRHLAVCLATYRRPAMFDRLLDSFTSLIRPDGCDLELRIVDNDAEGSAQASVDAIRDRLGAFGQVRYEIEPQQNIAAARNRGLAMGPADLIAFVDDDEVVPADWLVQLVRSIDATGADAVFGPVQRRCPRGASRWMRRSGFLDKSVPSNDGPMSWAGTRTSNTLVLGQWFYEKNYRFDHSFGRSGGSDTDLFTRMAAQGGRYAASTRASVWEDIEPERANFRWLWKREYRNGLVYHRYSANDSGAHHPAAQFAFRLAKSMLLIIKGSPRVLCGRLEGVCGGLLILALACGGLTAWLVPKRATRYVEYGRSDTAPGLVGSDR